MWNIIRHFEIGNLRTDMVQEKGERAGAEATRHGHDHGSLGFYVNK